MINLSKADIEVIKSSLILSIHVIEETPTAEFLKAGKNKHTIIKLHKDLLKKIQ